MIQDQRIFSQKMTEGKYKKKEWKDKNNLKNNKKNLEI